MNEMVPKTDLKVENQIILGDMVVLLMLCVTEFERMDQGSGYGCKR